MQEKYIGRRKYSDLELSNEEKDPRAHNIIAQDNRDDEEHKIVRIDVVSPNPGEGARGSHFIGYALQRVLTRQTVINLSRQDVRLPEHSTAAQSQLLYIQAW